MQRSGAESQAQPSLARRSIQSTSRAWARGPGKGEGFAECEFVGQSGGAGLWLGHLQPGG